MVNTVTGEITKINWTVCEDVSSLTGEPKTISVSLTGTEGGNVKLRHYLWNDLANMQSLKNYERLHLRQVRQFAKSTQQT